MPEDALVSQSVAAGDAGVNMLGKTTKLFAKRTISNKLGARKKGRWYEPKCENYNEMHWLQRTETS